MAWWLMGDGHVWNWKRRVLDFKWKMDPPIKRNIMARKVCLHVSGCQRPLHIFSHVIVSAAISAMQAATVENGPPLIACSLQPCVSKPCFPFS